MSPDDIFAAQFWPWPDPAIKRDAQGRVLFVNAAFLTLYGGQVENWRGNAVGGWPAPQANGGTPYRFETRMPTTNGSEQVYDWMEQTLVDGSAFALARNVTVFTQAPQPDPAAAMVPQHVEQTPAAPLTQPDAAIPAYQQGEPVYHLDTVDAQIETGTEAYVDVHVQTEVPARPVLEEQPTQQWGAPEIPDVPMLQEEPALASIPVPEIEIPNIEIPSDELYTMTETPQPAEAFYEAPEMSQEHMQEPSAPTATAAPEREYERRALPLGDNSSVLGSNWRDAVIARAVGADDPSQAAKAEETVAALADVVAADSAGGPIRILLAEDNAINALLTRTLLEAEGHIVDTVEDGVLAVQAMKTSTYDLIFMDMRMPNMDGLEATRKIRSLNAAGRRLPIIALTANAFDDDRNACFDSGMNDFMTKPVSAEELSEKVQNWTSEEAKARLMKAA